MKLAITASSQKLSDIMSTAQKEEAIRAKNNVPLYNVIIQTPTGITTEVIYVAFGRAAVVGESLKMILDSTLSFEDVTLKDTYIISESGANEIIVETN